MIWDAPAPRVFGLPPGADLAASLAQGLRALCQGAPPEAMARITVFVNSARMRRRLTQELAAQGPGFLPRIRLVTDIAPPPQPGDQPPAFGLEQRLQMMTLIAPLMRGAAAAGQPMAPEAAVFDVAESLARLLAEIEEEEVPLSRLEELPLDQTSDYWRRSLAFLRIALPLFQAQSSPASRWRRGIAALAQDWQANPPQDPILVAGSTGSRGGTLALMLAVAGLPRGAVLVPGLDPHLPRHIWQALDRAPAAEDHPQFRMVLLARALGQSPADFRTWPWFQGPVPQPERGALVSMALRPAPVTDQWLAEGPDLGDMAAATQGLSLITAPTPRAEALALAMAMRGALREGKTAALVTADRVLARRVGAALARWGIRADDAAGKPLALSPPGRLLRQIAEVLCLGLTPQRLIALLKHPLVATGAEGLRGPHLRLTHELELFLRKTGALRPSPRLLGDFVAQCRDNGAAAWAAGLGMLLTYGLDPQAQDPAPLALHLTRQRELAESLARGQAAEGAGGLWQEDAGRACLSLVDQLAQAAPGSEPMDARTYRAMFESLIAERNLIEAARPDPRLQIIGPREVRETTADLFLLSGLNEGTWPRAPLPDPWLNRPLRAAAGLLLPDRQIGLAAHDFEQAIAKPEVILSRALRDADAETVPARWLNRLTNLLGGLERTGGPRALGAMEARGKRWLDMALALEAPCATMPPAPRPSPAPPLAARPRSYSVTEIEKLILDPYAIYARRVLRLEPLDPLGEALDARDRGIVLHKALERFVDERPGPDPESETFAAANARLLDLTRFELDKLEPSPTQRIEWLARMQRAAGPFLTFDRDPERGGRKIALEAKTSMPLDTIPVSLVAKVDRIDSLADDSVEIIDYKTGQIPTDPQIRHYAKQLLLTMAMAERGAFSELGPLQVSRLTYVSLTSDASRSNRDILPKLADQLPILPVLERLLAEYLVPGKGFTARNQMERNAAPGDYDHLSRHGEWEATDWPGVMAVGQGENPDPRQGTGDE